MSLVANGISWAWGSLKNIAFSNTGAALGRLGESSLLFQTGRRILSHTWHQTNISSLRRGATLLSGMGMCALGIYHASPLNAWHWAVENIRPLAEALGGGLLCVLGKKLASHAWHHPRKYFSPLDRSVALLAGVGMCAAGAYLTATRISHLCFPASPSLYPPREHPYELEVEDFWGKDMLQFDWRDPRNKVLFLSGDENPNSAFLPSTNQKIFGQLNDFFDVKYQMIRFPQQICGEIWEGAAAGNLIGLILRAHGTSDDMNIAGGFEGDAGILSRNTTWPYLCFEGLSKHAKIILDSCSTGKNADGIGQYIADVSQRLTYAPTEDIYPHSLRGITPSFEAHFTNRTANRDITAVFSPRRLSDSSSLSFQKFRQLFSSLIGAYTILQIVKKIHSFLPDILATNTGKKVSHFFLSHQCPQANQNAEGNDEANEDPPTYAL